MNTGCQPPYCHGTGGWCGCNCNCCPPPCCPIIAVYFECGTACAIITNTCCPSVPNVVFVTFSGATGDCTCLNGLSVTLTYVLASLSWVGTYTACGADSQIALLCGGGSWTLAGGSVPPFGTGGCAFTSGPAIADSCTPLLISFPAFGVATCCTGTIIATVTDTPPMTLNAHVSTKPTWDNLPIQGLPPSEIPEFNPNPILSEDKRFSFGNSPCSVPCETKCVELSCGGFEMPCCCLELLDGKIYSVGNGYVTAAETIVLQEDCGSIGTVLINGQPPPVFVQDCEEIIVTIVPDDPTCCECKQVDVQCAPCNLMASKKPLWKRKVDPRTGKTKLNPNTGKPIIVLDRFELKKRVLARINQLKQRRNKH